MGTDLNNHEGQCITRKINIVPALVTPHRRQAFTLKVAIVGAVVGVWKVELDSTPPTVPMIASPQTFLCKSSYLPTNACRKGTGKDWHKNVCGETISITNVSICLHNVTQTVADCDRRPSQSRTDHMETRLNIHAPVFSGATSFKESLIKKLSLTINYAPIVMLNTVSAMLQKMQGPIMLLPSCRFRYFNIDISWKTVCMNPCFITFHCKFCTVTSSKIYLLHLVDGNDKYRKLLDYSNSAWFIIGHASNARGL